MTIFHFQYCLFFIISFYFVFSCSSRVTMEPSYQHDFIPQNFRIIGSAPSDKEITLHFALKHENKDYFHSIFTKVSNPNSESYGQYLSWEEVEDILVNKSSRDKVIQWLKEQNIDDYEITGTGDWILIHVSVEQAESLLDTSFSLIRTNSNSKIIRSLVPYSLPTEIAEFIDFVGGVHGFVGLVAKSHKRTDKLVPVGITPEVAKEQTFSTGIVGISSNNSQAVAQFLNQYYAPSDLSQFQTEYNLTVQPVATVMGTNDVNLPGVEATLDIEYIMAMGQDITTWFVSTGGRHEGQEPFLTWIETMESTANSPWIHSVSYGDVESSISVDYATRCETEFQKFGTTGRTIFFASGDDGVGCKSGSCISGKHTLQPNWPATSPSVTSVGGIVLESSGNLEGDQISSGGFSNIFAQQSWQSTAVTTYLNSVILPNEYFNTSNRAVPDISAFSSDVRIVYKGKDSGVGGTSCASPTVAGIFALLNDVRLQNNMPTLGFVNPLLYQIAASHSDAFTDITTGANSHLCCSGFTAAAGWDPITGLGLPNYSTLAQYILSN